MACRFVAFTVTNNPDHPGAERLRRSAKFWGWDLKWIAQEGWDRTTFRAEQLGQLEAIRKYEPDFFLYLDTWDTIFCGPPQELQLEKGVLNFGGDAVLLSEILPPGKNTVKINPEAFPTVPLNGFRYINGGVIWGDSLILQELAGDYLQNYGGMMNQDYFNQRLLFEHGLYRKRLQVDFEARTCINIMNMSLLVVERQSNNRLLYKPFRTNPVVLHSPGSSSTVAKVPQWMEEVYCASDN